MSVLTVANINATVRSRVGDDNSNSYLMADLVLNEKISNQAAIKLSRFVKKEVEDISTTGNGGNNYTLPSTIRKEQIQRLKIRTGSDAKTDQPLGNVEIHHSTIYLPFTISSATTLVIWYHSPYVIGTDDLPTQVAEFLYKILEYDWYDYAIKKRADFEQWAALGRSSATISEIRLLKNDVENELSELANSWGETMEVLDAGGGS